MSEYYTSPGTPGLRDPLSSEQIRDEFSALDQAFSMLPDPIGGGQPGFDGGVWTNAVLQNAELQNCRLGLNSAPSFGSVSYITFAPTNIPALGAGNRAWARTSTGALRVVDNTTNLFMIDNSGNVVVGDGHNELATTATAKFLYIPTCNGAPTGVPGAYPAAVPLVFDRLNAELYAYSGGAWISTALT